MNRQAACNKTTTQTSCLDVEKVRNPTNACIGLRKCLEKKQPAFSVLGKAMGGLVWLWVGKLALNCASIPTINQTGQNLVSAGALTLYTLCRHAGRRPTLPSLHCLFLTVLIPSDTECLSQALHTVCKSAAGDTPSTGTEIVFRTADWTGFALPTRGSAYFQTSHSGDFSWIRWGRALPAWNLSIKKWWRWHCVEVCVLRLWREVLETEQMHGVVTVCCICHFLFYFNSVILPLCFL